MASGAIRTIEITTILRSLRILKLFRELRQWRIIIQTIESLISPFLSLLLVAFVVFLFFSTIGDRAFGGVMNTASRRTFSDSTVPDSYVEMNFNDLFCSFITLFSLMIVNNWNLIVKLYIAVGGTEFSRPFIYLYFLSVIFVLNIVLLNIVLAFAIDMYSSVESLNIRSIQNANSSLGFTDGKTTDPAEGDFTDTSEGGEGTPFGLFSSFCVQPAAAPGRPAERRGQSQCKQPA